MKKYLSPPMLSATLTPQGKQLKTRLEQIFSPKSRKKGYFIPALVVIMLACGTLVACVPREAEPQQTQAPVPEAPKTPTVIVSVPPEETGGHIQPSAVTEPQPVEQPPAPELETEEEREGTTFVLTEGSDTMLVDGVEVTIHRSPGEPIYFQEGVTIEVDGIVISPEKEREGLIYENPWPEDNDNEHLNYYTPVQGYIPPLPDNGTKRTITQTYGTKVHPITGVEATHNGVDVSAGYGCPVYAAADGTVEQAGWSDIYGNHVILRHTDGSTSMYAHLASYYVETGETVAQKQYIGNVGDTGEATGAHLHFELRNAENLTMDPTYLFEG